MILVAIKRKLQSLHARMAIRLVTRGATPLAASDGPALIVAPHQDDETLGCGGLIAARCSVGCPVHIAFLTDGRLGGETQENAVELERRVSTRNAEARAAAAHLGVAEDHLHFMEGQDGALRKELNAAPRALSSRLADLVLSHGIAEVFVTHRRDGHPDHEAAYEMMSSLLGRLPHPVRLLQYPVWLWWSGPILSRLRVRDLRVASAFPLGAHLATKKEALDRYSSQTARFPKGFAESLLSGPELFFRTV